MQQFIWYTDKQTQKLLIIEQKIRIVRFLEVLLKILEFLFLRQRLKTIR